MPRARLQSLPKPFLPLHSNLQSSMRPHLVISLADGREEATEECSPALGPPPWLFCMASVIFLRSSPMVPSLLSCWLVVVSKAAAWFVPLPGGCTTARSPVILSLIRFAWPEVAFVKAPKVGVGCCAGGSRRPEWPWPELERLWFESTSNSMGECPTAGPSPLPSTSSKIAERVRGDGIGVGGLRGSLPLLQVDSMAVNRPLATPSPSPPSSSSWPRLVVPEELWGAPLLPSLPFARGPPSSPCPTICSGQVEGSGSRTWLRNRLSQLRLVSKGILNNSFQAALRKLTSLNLCEPDATGASGSFLELEV